MIFLYSCRNERKGEKIIREKVDYQRDIESDTTYIYYDNNKKTLRSKGMVKNGLKTGWWQNYSPKGILKSKEEYLIINDSTYKNQSIQYNEHDEINYNSSSFFKLKLPDTLFLGKNAGQLYYYSNFNDATKKYLYVIIENEYSPNNIKKDTFINDNDYTRFGIYANKIGIKKVEGLILEQLLYKKVYSKDSAELIFKTHKKYFEKEVYIKDTVD